MSHTSRINRLEELTNPPQLIIGLPEFDGEELIAYTVGRERVSREPGEERPAFEERVRASRHMDVVVLFGKGDEGLL